MASHVMYSSINMHTKKHGMQWGHTRHKCLAIWTATCRVLPEKCQTHLQNCWRRRIKSCFQNFSKVLKTACYSPPSELLSPLPLCLSELQLQGCAASTADLVRGRTRLCSLRTGGSAPPSDSPPWMTFGHESADPSFASLLSPSRSAVPTRQRCREYSSC